MKPLTYHLEERHIHIHLFYIMNTVSDCANFTLRMHSQTKVNGISALDEIPNVSSGECFFACFNNSGCFTFSYNISAQRCALYSRCDDSCVLSVDTDVETYVRECFPATITGMILFLELLSKRCIEVY